MSVRCPDPHMFVIHQNVAGWHVCAEDAFGEIIISVCDTEAEAQDVQAALVIAAAGRA